MDWCGHEVWICQPLKKKKTYDIEQNKTVGLLMGCIRNFNGHVLWVKAILCSHINSHCVKSSTTITEPVNKALCKLSMKIKLVYIFIFATNSFALFFCEGGGCLSCFSFKLHSFAVSDCLGLNTLITASGGWQGALQQVDMADAVGISAASRSMNRYGDRGFGCFAKGGCLPEGFWRQAVSYKWPYIAYTLKYSIR